MKVQDEFDWLETEFRKCVLFVPQSRFDLDSTVFIDSLKPNPIEMQPTPIEMRCIKNVLSYPILLYVAKQDLPSSRASTT